jgi:hypothetical protein
MGTGKSPAIIPEGMAGATKIVGGQGLAMNYRG